MTWRVGWMLAPALAAAQATPQRPIDSAWSLERAVRAPERLMLSGTVRARLEAIEGQARPDFYDDDALFSLRSTLFGAYDFGGVTVGAEIYDSRTYLEGRRTPVTANEVNVAELSQAYVAVVLREPLGAGSTGRVKAGRQTINLGSRRLVGANEYRNTVNSFTGVRLDVTAKGGLNATAIAVLPAVRLPDDGAAVRSDDYAFDAESIDHALWGVVASGPAARRARVEVTYLGFHEEDSPVRPTRDRTLHTLGGRLYREPAPGKLDFELEGFHQFGRASDSVVAGAARQHVSAGLLHLALARSFRGRWRPRAGLFYDWVSGDGRGRTFGRFDQLFGVRRFDLAPSGLYGAVGRANISSPGLRLEAQPGRGSDLALVYRPLWLAARTDAFSTSGVRDARGASGAFAGHQLDVRARLWIVPRALQLELDGLYLAKGRFLREAPNAPRNGDTRYGSVNLTAYF